MKNNKTFFNGLFSKISWYWGIVIGIAASSIVVFAAVNLITFSPGTNISSAEVNANFNELKNRILFENYGVTLGMSGDQNITSGPTLLEMDLLLSDNAPGGYSVASKKFTVQPGEAGLYSILVASIDDVCQNQPIQIFLNGVYSQDTVYMCDPNPNSKLGFIKLNDNDYIEFKVTYSKGSYNVIAADTFIKIKREAKL